MDELLFYNPEPCQTCSTGLQYMKCHDGVLRCRTCVNELARANGWDEKGEGETVSEIETPVEERRIVNNDPTLFD